MIHRATDAAPVTLSVAVYRLLLYAYPKAFRREYGPHMLQVFRDSGLRIYRKDGPPGMLSLWAFTLFDLLRSAVEEHIQKETTMTRNTLIRISGWAMVIGGTAFSLAFLTVLISTTAGMTGILLSGLLEDLRALAFFFGPVGIALGVLGLRARFGGEFGAVARSALLLLASAGTALVLIGDYMQSANREEGFTIFGVGTIVIFIGLELFGIMALRRKPQPRWNGLAAVAGFPISLVGVLAIAGPVGEGNPAMTLPFAVMTAVMGVALAMLGFLVQSDLPDALSAEPATT